MSSRDMIAPSSPCLGDSKRAVPMASSAGKAKGQRGSPNPQLALWKKEDYTALRTGGWVGSMWRVQKVGLLCSLFEDATQKLPDAKSSLHILFVMTVIRAKE